MEPHLERFYKNRSLIYKGILYLTAVVLIVSFFPREGKFKYEFQKGRAWQYGNLYAPFDFPINKSEGQLEMERQVLEKDKELFYSFHDSVANSAKRRLGTTADKLQEIDSIGPADTAVFLQLGTSLLDSLYGKGIFREADLSRSVILVKDTGEITLGPEAILDTKQAMDQVDSYLTSFRADYKNLLAKSVKNVLEPNVLFNKDRTQQALEQALSSIPLTVGKIVEGELIIAKGEMVEAEKFNVLNSLKSQYESELWKGSNFYFILFGYAVLVALVLVMLFLFLKESRPEIYADNNKVTFIFFNIVTMVFVTTLVVKNWGTYIYAVPLCILPLMLKNFFDARLGLFVHVLTVLILGFVVPNSFEYIFLQIIAGIVTILTVSELYKRANLFISAGQITLIYMIGYFAFTMIQEGNLTTIKWEIFGLFLLNGMITLFAQPLIYAYEKIFGLVSDVSLLELSDTNSGLLKELSNKAPGTFHHSLQVANLAEAAANEIGANAMLVRVGALYHDIGKMNRPTFFSENQVTNSNPHNDLPPKESARIIINHVIEGIELARKHKLPDRVIDFLRTHHGTSLVYYFFKKQQEQEPEVGEKDFRYPGPVPFSKETAILMMADAVEAASKSLKSPTYPIIDAFVDKIVQGQLEAKQFLNATITLKEIEIVKKVLKMKLTNIYHLRVEYPE